MYSLQPRGGEQRQPDRAGTQRQGVCVVEGCEWVCTNIGVLCVCVSVCSGVLGVCVVPELDYRGSVCA